MRKEGGSIVRKSRRFFIVLLALSVFLLSPEPFLQAMPRVQRVVLANHLVLLVGEEHSLPFVTLQLLTDSGARRDPLGKEGLADLTARGLLWGTSKRDLNAIYQELDFMGASLTSSSGRDYATLTLRVLKKDFDKGLDILMDVLTQPTFPEDELRREVEKTLASIQAAEDEPEEVAEKEFQKTLFLNSRYGHPVEGTRESLQRITREDLLQFYRHYYHPNNAILVVVGDITGDEIRSRVLPRIEILPSEKIPEERFVTGFADQKKTIKIDRSITQANIILGHRGVSRDNPDYYALTVMNYILGGGGFSSRLIDEIRVKRGLAYSVASFFDPGRYPGSFQIVLQTKNASARKAIALSLQGMDRIQKEPVSEKELEGAKKYLMGSFPMRLDTQGKLVNFLGQVEYYGLGLNYPDSYPSIIQAVTREDVLRVARTYLHPESIILVVVANLNEAGLE
jgi:zinc protease